MNKRVIFSVAAIASAALVGGALFALSATAQTQATNRIIGYSVYAHSHYVLTQQGDGTFRSCVHQRQTPLRRGEWRCTVLPALP